MFQPNPRSLPLPVDPPRQVSLAYICDLIVTHVAQDFALQPNAIQSEMRGSSRDALARQVAMYLAHVVFAVNFQLIGLAFRRDRTTVAHACRAIENRRDDKSFDDRIAALETTLRAALCGDAQ